MTNKTMKLFAGLSSLILVSSALTACSNGSSNYSSTSSATPPNVNGCKEWEWDNKNQQWYCDDEKFAKQNGVTSGTRVYYYNGMIHPIGIQNNSKFNKNSSKSSSTKSGNIGSGTKGGTSTGG